MSARSTGRRARASGSSSPSADRGRAALEAADFLAAHTNSALGRVRAGVDRAKPKPKVTRRQFAVDFNERTARSGRSLRAPDQALESKDEGVHLWRTQRNLHHRSPKDPEAFQGRDALRGGNGSPGQDGPIRR